MYRQAAIRNVRLFSTRVALRNKGPVEGAKDAAKTVDKTISQGIVKGIEKGGMYLPNPSTITHHNMLTT